jgi:hypothetical protein
MKALLAVLALATLPVQAHRLDEYLQGTLVSLGKDRLNAQMSLTPGVAVLPVVLAAIDTDGDGAISEAEQRSYAVRVLRDISIACDGAQLTPRLVSFQFPSAEEMKDGRGTIRLEQRRSQGATGKPRACYRQSAPDANLRVAGQRAGAAGSSNPNRRPDAELHSIRISTHVAGQRGR